ncbi:MAG: hydrogenase maturation protease [Candidatus Aminicenantales bacterium]|jgi:hydrogenase maturation protease
MKILIIGIGNPGRGDDGLGPALAARLAGAGLGALSEGAVIGVPGRTAAAVWRYQLNIEDAHLARDYQAVVFADASSAGDGSISLERIAPAAAIAFTTHEMSPAGVLALCEELYGRAPKGWLLSMSGFSWEFAEVLSPGAIKNLEAAREYLLGFLDFPPSF